jgi:hypothetical protein
VVCQNCGTEQTEDSQFCRKCGASLSAAPATSSTSETHPAITSESNQQNSANVPPPCSPAAACNEKGNSSLNFGTLVFAFFSVLSLVVCLAKGITLISIAETSVWAAAAIYWHRRDISSPRANLIVLLLAVCVAAGEGYSLRQSGSPSYTYLKEGDIQFRTDARRGRTDRLFGNGWRPVSFDRPPDVLPFDLIPSIVLNNGSWETRYRMLYAPGEIIHGQFCFDVQNNSDYVLKDVEIIIVMHPVFAKNDIGVTVPVDLKAPYALDKRESGHLCGRVLVSPLSTWNYSVSSANGWKQ